jgi:integrase
LVQVPSLRHCGIKRQETREYGFFPNTPTRKYVFLNQEDESIEIETLWKNAWVKGLKKAGIEYRSIIQTRHTFATLMVSAGENLGWAMKMMGHSSLKMITDKYFSYIPNMTHNCMSKFLEEDEKKVGKGLE